MIPRDRILVLTDLFMGALWADDEFSEDEQKAVRGLLAELLEVEGPLPDAVEERITHFEPLAFDLEEASKEFAADPPMAKRRLLELVGMMANADGAFDIKEDEYLRALAEHLAVEYAEHAELTLGIDIGELRESFAALRAPPPPMVDSAGRTSKPPPPPIVPPTHVPRAAPVPDGGSAGDD